ELRGIAQESGSGSAGLSIMGKGEWGTRLRLVRPASPAPFVRPSRYCTECECTIRSSATPRAEDICPGGDGGHRRHRADRAARCAHGCRKIFIQWKSARMPRIIFVAFDGTEHPVDARNGLSLMEAAR